MTTAHPVARWYEKVCALEGLWASVKVACVCVRTGNYWMNLVGKAELSPHSPEEPVELRPVLETDTLLALEGALSLQTVGNLVENLMVSALIWEDMRYHVRISSEDTRSDHWYERTLERIYAKRDLGVDFRTLSVSFGGPPWHQILPQTTKDQIDESLRVMNPPFDGISGLARRIGLRGLQHGASTLFELIAPLPLRFHPPKQDFENKALTVNVEIFSNIPLEEVRVSGIYTGNQTSISLGTLNTWEEIRQPSGRF